jgi:hypothetical protein
MSRQFGSALGVALLVAVLGTPSPSEVVDVFKDAWWMMAAAGAASAVSFALVGPLTRAPETVAEEIEEAIGSLGPEMAA